MLQSRCRPARTAPAHDHAHACPCAEDAALIAAARADPRRFAPLYERYISPVYRYCYLQLGNAPAAEDATSEVFLKALSALPGFRGGTVAAWLLQIARNTVLDARRRHRPTVPIEAAGEIADRGRTPEGMAVDAATLAALRDALAALPNDQRTAVELQLAGWSGEQIAAALHKSPAAVYMLRARALARMTKALRRAGWVPEERHDADA